MLNEMEYNRLQKFIREYDKLTTDFKQLLPILKSTAGIEEFSKSFLKTKAEFATWEAANVGELIG